MLLWDYLTAGSVSIVGMLLLYVYCLWLDIWTLRSRMMRAPRFIATYRGSGSLVDLLQRDHYRMRIYTLVTELCYFTNRGGSVVSKRAGS